MGDILNYGKEKRRLATEVTSRQLSAKEERSTSDGATMDADQFRPVGQIVNELVSKLCER
jgi:two-component sensor histidine kinase